MWILTIENESGMDRNEFNSYEAANACLDRAEAADWYGGDAPTSVSIVKED